MKTDFELAKTLKELMTEYPLEEISVTLLTKKCHIKRQTFYYHFRDIYDLLTLVFLNEKINGLKDVKSLDDVVKVIYKYYDKNSKFLDAAISSAGKELVVELFYHAYYNSTLKIILDYELGHKLDINQRKAIARFYASAYSQGTIYYLSNTKNKTEANLLKCFEFVNSDSLKNSIQNAIKVREKDE